MFDATTSYIKLSMSPRTNSQCAKRGKNTSDPSCSLICTFFTAFPLPLGRAGTAIRSTAVTSILTGLVTKSLKESKTWVRLIYLVHVLARMIH